MARQFLTPIDLNKNELQNFLIQNLASPPASPGTGQVYLNTAATVNQPTFYQGTAWVELALRTSNTYLGKQTLAPASSSVSGSLNIPTGSGNTPVSGDLYNLSGVLTFYNGAVKTIAYTDSAMTSTLYIGTTAVVLNRGSGALSLTGITSIDGTAANATNISVTNDTSTAIAVYPTWVTATGGNFPANTTTSALSFVPSTGVLTATGFSGSGAALTSLTSGNLTGTIPSTVLGNSTVYIGTTAVALNRSSGTLALTGITSIDGNAATASLATKSTNLVGGNGTTLLGTMPYQSGTDTTTLLAPNVVASQKFMAMTGTGTNGAAPSWVTLVDGDIPTALTGKSYNGLTITSTTGSLTIAAGKTLTANNSLTFSGTDGSTLNIGTGGTLGTAAYTAASAYATLANKLDQFAAPAADVAWNGKKITGLGYPTNGTDAANKQYIDDTVAGISWKNEVRVATTAPGTLATSFANGSMIDGQTLATNDRILIKDQATDSENGIYIVNVSGAPTRATDADTDAKLKGSALFVYSGSTNQGTRWVLNTVGVITVDSTSLTFVKFDATAAYTASNGVLLTANNLTVQPDTGGQSGLSVSSTGVKINPTVVVGAANTYIARRISFTVGDNSSTSIVLTHNLNTRDVVASVYRTLTPWDEVGCDVQKTTVNTITLLFSVAPTTAKFTCSIVG